jgi:hypothetical protein
VETDDRSGDVRAIEELISSQFRSLDWTRDKDADWAAFAEGFLPGAALFPAARPVRRQTIEGFMERMKELRSQGKLISFKETPLGWTVHVFGNVAVAIAGCEMLGNGSDVTRDVSGFLLVKDNDVWRIAAQAWDVETDPKQIPAYLANRQRP